MHHSFAGDSFNGVFLRASPAVYDIRQAIELAASAMDIIIHHTSAVVPNENFTTVIVEQKLGFEHQAN